MIRLSSLGFFWAISLCLSAAPALVWQTIPEGRRAALPSVPAAAPGFTRMDLTASGIQFTNVLLEARKLANANLMNGSGVALGDYDGDGLCDIYLCDLNGNNRLFRNLGGWQFRDVTDESGTACPKQTSTGAVFADLDGDGRLDLIVTSMGGPHACFLNLGNGKFTNITAQAGITSRLGATSMALADIDGNGTMDLYVADYGVTSILRSGGALNVSYENGKPVVHGRYAQRVKIIDNMMWELGEPDALYLNDGKGRFSQVPWTGGGFLNSNGTPLKTSDIPWDQGLSVIFRDINRDGFPDIYVCNDAFTPDRLWINDGKGHFKALETLKLRTTSHFSMGVDFADIDRDGNDEFMVVDMLSRDHTLVMTQKGTMPPQPYVPGDLDAQWQMRRNTLQMGDGAGGFSDIAFYAGVAGSEWSWAPIFVDVDLDGWEDIIISNGFEHNTDDMDIQEKVHSQVRSVQDSRRTLSTMYPPLKTPNVAFHNKHDLTFDEVGKQWGFDAKEVSNGMALADLDNDGDLDVVVNCLNAPPLLYRNNASAPRIAVRLKGRAPNTQGIGAKITVEGGPVTQSQEVMAGGRFLSGDDPMRVFAAGAPDGKLQISVTWRDGGISTVRAAEPGYIYEVDQAGAQSSPVKAGESNNAKPLFAEMPVGHRHQTDAFDDFSRQPSLPFHLNAFGPGLVFADLNGDGFDDLVTGAGRSGKLQIATNNQHGGFVSFKVDISTDATAGLLCWPRSEKESELLVSLENDARHSSNNIKAFTVRRDGSLQSSDSGANFHGEGVGGPLALTEVNGEMTLFWGARFQSAKFPETAPSHLYRFRKGQWILDSKNENALKTLGLVSGALWSDLDSDGSPELIVTCQWAPIRIFSLVDGTLTERTQALGLSGFSGLWQGIATGDFDGDGRMDFVAGNWGLNSFYNQAPDRQIALYYGPFNGPGDVGMIEAYFDTGLNKTVPWRDKRVLSAALPWMNEKFATHAEFARAGIEDVLKGRPAQMLKASTLASAVFLNRGSHFEQHLLPAAAQFAPVFGIVAADFDNDGATDLFLAQNFFAVREFDSRLDAGRGLLLRGDGKGGFVPLKPAESGVLIYGEQRGCAIGNLNNDGRLDLVVAQYANETKLLTNQTAPAGLSLHFKGGAQNVAAAGAQFQVGDQGAWGPLQEVQLGGGYWSQSSLTKIVAAPKTRGRIRVRWAGGHEWMEASLPDGKRFEIATAGGVLQVKPL